MTIAIYKATGSHLDLLECTFLTAVKVFVVRGEIHS